MQREARQEVSRVGRSRKGREKERKMSIGEKKKRLRIGGERCEREEVRGRKKMTRSKEERKDKR